MERYDCGRGGRRKAKKRHLDTSVSNFVLYELLVVENVLHRDQEMSNLLEEKQYGKAFRLALTLDQPNRLLNFVNGRFLVKMCDVALSMETCSAQSNFINLNHSTSCGAEYLNLVEFEDKTFDCS